MLIGLTGKAGAGKDTVAALLTDHDFAHTYLAFPIKSSVGAMLGVPISRWEDRDWKETALPGLGVSPRQLAQTLGTEWGRDVIDPDFWIKLTQMRMDEHPEFPDWVISDVRFDNEARWIKDSGGFVVHVDREVAGVATHISEAGVAYRDYTLDNNGTIEELTSKVERMLSELLLRGAA